jgi:hypothetical protein
VGKVFLRGLRAKSVVLSRSRPLKSRAKSYPGGSGAFSFGSFALVCAREFSPSFSRYISRLKHHTTFLKYSLFLALFSPVAISSPWRYIAALLSDASFCRSKILFTPSAPSHPLSTSNPQSYFAQRAIVPIARKRLARIVDYATLRSLLSYAKPSILYDVYAIYVMAF